MSEQTRIEQLEEECTRLRDCLEEIKWESRGYNLPLHTNTLEYLVDKALTTTPITRQLMELRAVEAEIVRAAMVAGRQKFGLVHNWAGMWHDCPQCKMIFAYGWNWSDDPEDKPPEKCPACNLMDVTERRRELIEHANKGEG